MHMVNISRPSQCDTNVARCMITTAGDPVLELEYPRVFANAIAPIVASDAKRFRYLHLSGAMVERDQEKSLWMKANMRKIKVGESEHKLGFDRNRVELG